MLALAWSGLHWGYTAGNWFVVGFAGMSNYQVVVDIHPGVSGCGTVAGHVVQVAEQQCNHEDIDYRAEGYVAVAAAAAAAAPV